MYPNPHVNCSFLRDISRTVSTAKSEHSTTSPPPPGNINSREVLFETKILVCLLNFHCNHQALGSAKPDVVAIHNCFEFLTILSPLLSRLSNIFLMLSVERSSVILFRKVITSLRQRVSFWSMSMLLNSSSRSLISCPLS